MYEALAIASLLLSVVAGWAVVSQRLACGVTLKLGLAAVAVGLLVVADMAWQGRSDDLTGPLALVVAGVLVCAAWWVVREPRHAYDERDDGA